MKRACIVLVVMLALALQGCALPFQGHYRHGYLSCTMNDGSYQTVVYIERATGADSAREKGMFRALCTSARALTQPTHYEGPVPR